MHSTAQASGMAPAALPPQAAAAARHSAGRIRLPPAKSEYRIALWIVAGLADPAGRNRSSASLTADVPADRKVWTSKSGFARRLELLVDTDMRSCFRKWRFPAQADSAFLYCNQADTG